MSSGPIFIGFCRDVERRLAGLIRACVFENITNADRRNHPSPHPFAAGSPSALAGKEERGRRKGSVPGFERGRKGVGSWFLHLPHPAPISGPPGADRFPHKGVKPEMAHPHTQFIPTPPTPATPSKPRASSGGAAWRLGCRAITAVTSWALRPLLTTPNQALKLSSPQ